ncbi:MAG: DUF885 domain-containing protein [Phenylobacterium sp.]
MTTTRRALLSSAGSAAALAALPAAALAADANALSDAVIQQMAGQLLAEYPENASFLGLDQGARAGLKRRLTDRSIAGDAARGAACAARLKRLKGIDRTRLTGLPAVNYDAALYAHELAAEGYAGFTYGDNAVLNTLQAESNTPYAINQGSGFFATIPDFLDSQHGVKTPADAEAYLERLKALARGLDDETARTRREEGLGVIAPDFLLDTTLGQMSAYAGRPVTDWGLVGSLQRRAKAAGLSDGYARGAAKICEAEVAPALARQIAALKAARAKAGHDAGVWRLPEGEAYYAWLLKVGTTTPMTADEVHQLGLEQAASLAAEMDALLKAQGLSEGPVGARMTALSKDPKFLFPNTEEGRAQLLAYLNGVVAAMRPKLAEGFATLPKADLVIKRVPPEIEAGASNGYEQDGSIDGTRPASYYINLKDTANWPKFALPTLTFHEGIPGHVWQGVFAHRLPVMRSLLAFNAYVEGWALYAEQLGDELGLYTDDPFGRLGYLQSIQFRACRLVVDTGLHAKHWSREQAIAWFIDNNGIPAGRAQSEVDRYCAWPGQACGYKIGHSWINRLRDKAKAQMGARFDLRTFDDALVKSGAVPLTVLDRVVEDYIGGR